MKIPGESMIRAREKIVRNHMNAEIQKSALGTVDTFSHPRYEVVPTGEVHDGADLVCERINFDLLTILTQLGITRDINSLGGKLALFLGKPQTFISAWIRQIFS